MWSFSGDGINANLYYSGYKVAIDDSGNVYCGFYFDEVSSAGLKHVINYPYNPFSSVIREGIVKLDEDGNMVWVFGCQNSGRFDIDNDGGVFVCSPSRRYLPESNFASVHLSFGDCNNYTLFNGDPGCDSNLESGIAKFDATTGAFVAVDDASVDARNSTYYGFIACGDSGVHYYDNFQSPAFATDFFYSRYRQYDPDDLSVTFQMDPTDQYHFANSNSIREAIHPVYHDGVLYVGSRYSAETLVPYGGGCGSSSGYNINQHHHFIALATDGASVGANAFYERSANQSGGKWLTDVSILPNEVCGFAGANYVAGALRDDALYDETKYTEVIPPHYEIGFDGGDETWMCFSICKSVNAQQPSLEIGLKPGLFSWIGDTYVQIPGMALRFAAMSPVYRREYLGAERVAEVYVCTLTGSPTITIPLSGITIRRDAEAMTLTAIAPISDAVSVADLVDRAGETLNLYRGVRFPSGVTQIELMLSCILRQIRSDRGGLRGSATLTASTPTPPAFSRPRALKGISYIATTSDSRRVRCAIDTYLAPGDLAIISETDSFVASEITISISPLSGTMEVSE